MAVRGQSKNTDRRDELAIMISYIIIGGLYVFIIIPYLSNAVWFFTLNTVEAYILWNIGNVFLIGGVLGFTFNLVKGHFDFFGFLRAGLAGFLVFSWVFDMIQPPLAWSTTGQLLIPVGTSSLENTAVDYMFGWIYMQVGIVGPLLYYMVYFVTPVIGIILAALIMTPKQFISQSGARS